MKSIALLTLCVFSVCAFSPSLRADDGKNAALQQCNRFNRNDYYNACLETLYAASFFEVRGVAECNRFNRNDYLLECLRFVANRHFDAFKLNNCSRYTRNDWLYHCIQQSATN